MTANGYPDQQQPIAGVAQFNDGLDSTGSDSDANQYMTDESGTYAKQIARANANARAAREQWRQATRKATGAAIAVEAFRQRDLDRWVQGKRELIDDEDDKVADGESKG